jgi:hypothetical protein
MCTTADATGGVSFTQQEDDFEGSSFSFDPIDRLNKEEKATAPINRRELFANYKNNSIMSVGTRQISWRPEPSHQSNNQHVSTDMCTTDDAAAGVSYTQQEDDFEGSTFSLMSITSRTSDPSDRLNKEEKGATVPINRRELFANYKSNPSMMSMGTGVSVRSQLSMLSRTGSQLSMMDLTINSDFSSGRLLDAIINSHCDDDEGSQHCENVDGSSNVILNPLKEESETTEAHDRRISMTRLTAKLGDVTGWVSSRSKDWVKDLADPDRLESGDPFVFDNTPIPIHDMEQHQGGNFEVRTVSDFDDTPIPVEFDNLNRPSNDSNVMQQLPTRASDTVVPSHANHRRLIDQSRDIEPTDDDVLFGKGGKINKHPGNLRFRAKALELRPRYESCETNDEKTHISNVLLESVTSQGHRFLEKGNDGLWHEVIGNGRRKKASQALRERRS